MTQERQKPHEGAICGDASHDDRSVQETSRQSVGGPAELYGSTYGETPTPHADDVAVDRFAAAMKQKLAQARAKGRDGWQTCSKEDLSRMLRDHVEKGDPRDVANFCMFLWSLGHGIAQPEQPVAQAATGFDEWWDNSKTTAVPTSYRGWEESCRQAWEAGQLQPVALGETVAWLYTNTLSGSKEVRLECPETVFDLWNQEAEWSAQPLYTHPQPDRVAMTDEQMRPVFEGLLEGSLFKRRADKPEEYWDGNVQDDWNLFRDGVRFAERHHNIKGNKS